ncbi:CD0519/CD1768 family membrane protein [Facklamia languida]
MAQKVTYKKTVGPENVIFLIVFFGIFIAIGSVMGAANMLSTIMSTAFDLLVNTCLYIMAISVVAGALSGIFSEFGFVALVNALINIFMKPVYDLPGASSLGVLNCYLSDNPAILTLAGEDNFKRYFKKYQLPALTNLGTSFGMGLIVTTTMMGFAGEDTVKGALIGNLGAIIGSIVSVRLMLHFTRKVYGTTDWVETKSLEDVPEGYRTVRQGSFGSRLLEALLDGGKSGVDMGLAIIPGVIIMCTMVLLLTNGPGPDGVYTGGLGEGIPLLPWIGEKLSFILTPIFGFSSPASIAVPITALGSAGAAVGMAGKMAASGMITGSDVAVFTAMCMCWSGYLSTHIAMMDALDTKEVTGFAILSHTIGGLVAGAAANLIFTLIG